MISVQQSNHLKSIAILMMLCLHLFNTLNYQNLFEPLLYVGAKPLIYYISLFCDACVPIFAFVSGYGLYYKYQQTDLKKYRKDNYKRLSKLYIIYWIVVFLFVICLGTFLQVEGYPGSLTTLLGNLSGIVTTYNGAWWFFTIYVLFVLTSGFWFKLLDLTNPLFYFFGLLLLYLLCFYLRVYSQPNLGNGLLTFTFHQLVLFGCTLFQLLMGAFALRYSWNVKIQEYLYFIKSKNLFFIIGTSALIFFHGLFPNFIVAPFTAIAFVFLFLQLRLNQISTRFLDFFTPHATNIWLVHMFFYMIYYHEWIFSLKYPICVYLFLLLLSVISSIIINKINFWIFNVKVIKIASSFLIKK